MSLTEGSSEELPGPGRSSRFYETRKRGAFRAKRRPHVCCVCESAGRAPAGRCPDAPPADAGKEGGSALPPPGTSLPRSPRPGVGGDADVQSQPPPVACTFCPPCTELMRAPAGRQGRGHPAAQLIPLRGSRETVIIHRFHSRERGPRPGPKAGNSARGISAVTSLTAKV